MRGKNMTYYKRHRILAGFLCLCMLTSIFRGFRIVAFVTEGSANQPTNGAIRQADQSTMDNYKKVLDFSLSTRYAGRLWTDKTVFAYDYYNDDDEDWKNNILKLKEDDDGVNGEIALDADFLHVYSVLGSGVQINDPAPADLVLALDISGSMNSPLENEIEGWINTADPKNPATFLHGLGFYRGSEDNMSGNVVTAAQDDYVGYKEDDNGIPDAIVPVLPEDGNTLVKGQMGLEYVERYNKYLDFCNLLVNTIKNKYDDEQITDNEALNITDELRGETTGNVYLTQYLSKNENTTAETYTKIYAAYLKYWDAAEKIFGNDNDNDPWQSYNTDRTVQNAAWPDKGWEDVIEDTLKDTLKDTGVPVPGNPMQNANNAPNRMYYMIDATNRFIERYLSLNEKNRISVVVYDSVATVLMPLARYEKATVDGETKEYLSAEKHHWQAWGNGQWACTVTATAAPKGGYEEKENPFGDKLMNGVYTASVTSWSNTGTVIALNAGLDILANSDDTYSDKAKRTPILILMTDGAANVAMTTGLGDEDNRTAFDVDWSADVRKDTTKDGEPPFNKDDGMGLNNNHTYKSFNDTDAFRDKTSEGLTVYGAGYNHVYGAESNAAVRYAVVFNTLMSTAYRKTLVEQHYNATEDNPCPAYPENEDDREEWTEALIYTVGFGLNYYSENIQGVCKEILDPTTYFNGQHVNEELEKAQSNKEQKEFAEQLHKMFECYTNWKKDIKDDYKVSFKTKQDNITLNFPIENNSVGDGKNVTKKDINRNITYNTSYYEAVLKQSDGAGGANDGTLRDVFNQILSMIEGEMFTPVGGDNDLGVKDSVTYMDPMGKYMEVKDIKNLVFFGKNYENDGKYEKYDIVKYAVYSYKWNALYMKNSSKDENEEALTAGWYRGDPVEGSTIGVQMSKELPPGCSSDEDAWNNGWVYRIGFQEAARLVPNLQESNSPGDIEEKQKNTEYTFYKIKGDDEELEELRMNPAYGTKDNIPPETRYDENGDHLKKTGVYALADLRIWVENTGDYNDPQLEGSALYSDGNFDEALYVNIPTNMLPMRTVTINRMGEDDITYTVGTEIYPMRVFYTVGIESSLLTSDGSLNIAAGVSASYINKNKTTEVSAKEAARNIKTDRGENVVEFFANWYNPENRYAAYDYSRLNNEDNTFGDPVVSFSPNTNNRYYVFEKALPLYGRAFKYKDNQWKQVQLNEIENNPAGFGGKLIDIDLVLDETIPEDADADTVNTLITKALNEKDITDIQDDNVVFLKSDRLTGEKVAKPENADTPDPFASSGYYYMALEYFELHKDNKAEPVMYAVVRKGSEFGSAYQSIGINNGNMLCWHDVKGNYPDYRYLSYTDTKDASRGYNYIGYDDKDIFNIDAEGKETLIKPGDMEPEKAEQAEDIRKNGEWVLSARQGGLRVGDMTQSVESKGGKYNHYSDDYINERFSNTDSQNLRWGYYENNITRTANNYYLPTVSTASDIDENNIIINVYLGNNGRLWVSDTALLMTKLVEPGPGGIAPDDSKKEFDFQVYIEGLTGAHDAIRVHYNRATKTWQRQLHFIDLKLDGSRYLQTNDGKKVMVDGNGRRVQLQGNPNENVYVYADNGESIPPGELLYYVRIAAPDQSDVGGESTAFRIYHNRYCEKHGAAVKNENIVIHYYTGNGDEETKVEGDKAPEDFSGKRDFYAAIGMVSLVSKSEYDEADPTQIGSLTGEQFKDEFYLATMNPIGNDNGDTNVVIESPYNVMGDFLTYTLYFGYKYGASANGDIVTGDILNGTDLYVPVSAAVYNSKNDNPAMNTAEVRLESGWGLLFGSLASGVEYVLAERLDDDTIAEGYSFNHVHQITQSTDTNKPASEFPGNYYYVSGDTGAREEAGHFINTWSDDKTETQINGKDILNNDDPVKPGVQVGDLISYEIKWFNNAEKSAGVVIIDPLDEGVDFFPDNDGKYCPTRDAANAYLKKCGVDFTVNYDHVVIWYLKNQPAGANGVVNLTVMVNEKASKWWNYSNDGVADEPAGENEPNDFVVRNRATVRVADNVWNTNTVVNPVGEPKKTETKIERGEDSSADGYEDEIVTETGENANLLPGADGKYKGPLVFAGDKITYEISWRNYQNEDAAISISDILDENVRFVSAEYDPADVKDGEGKPLTEPNPNTVKIEASSDNTDVESETEVEGYGDDGSEKRKTIVYDAKDAKNRTVTWNLGKMPPGADGKVTLVVEVLESAIPEGYVDNTAYVRVGNEVQHTRTITNPTPRQEKTEVTPGDGAMVQIGGLITYEINWQNYKNEPAQVLIMDTLDPGVDYVPVADEEGMYYENGGTVSVTGANGTNVIDIPAHTVVWVLKNQPAGATGKVTLTVKVNENAKLGYSCNEEASGFTPSGEKDYEVLNQARIKVGNDAFIKTRIVENPVPEKTETSVSHATGEDNNPGLNPKPGTDNTYTGPLVFAGDEITYKIHWKNGNDEKADVIITDSLDKGVDYVSADNNGIYDKSTHTVIWKLPDWEPGSEGTVELKVNVNEKAAEAGVVKNQAGVRVNNDPFVETEIIENPTPHAEKTEVTPGEGMRVMPGDEIDYRITWNNYENEAADVVITDRLDPGVDFVSAGVNGDKLINVTDPPNGGTWSIPTGINFAIEEPTLSQTFEEQGICIYYFEKSHTVVWVLKNRQPNSEGVVDLKVSVNEKAEKFWSYDNPSAEPSDELNDDRVRNQAGVRVGTHEVKTRIIENPTKPKKTETSVNNTDVRRDIVVDGDVYVGPEVNVGDTITYRITWQNNAHDENNLPVKAQIKITDELDPGVDFVSASDNGSYDSDTHTVTWDLGEKNERERGSVTLIVRVNNKAIAATPEKVENDATVTVGNTATQTNKVENHVGKKGGLTVTKTVSGDEGETDRDWYFTVTLSGTNINDGQYGDMFFVGGVASFYLKHNESITANGLPAALGYTVTEREANIDGYTTISVGENGTIPVGNIAEVRFVNHKDTPPPENRYGNLIVAKTVTGNAGDTNREWHFRVELSDTGINGRYGNMLFTDGVAEFTLKHGMEAAAWDLPEGITYTVTEIEANQDGYITNISGATGTITDGETSKAEFVNDKNEDTPPPPPPSDNPPPEKHYANLIVTKTVTGNAGDSDREWHFRVELKNTNINAAIDGQGKLTNFHVELSDTDISGQYGSMFFINGVAEFTLKHGMEAAALDLPEGITYTVTELDANQDGYTTNASGAMGMISAGDTAKAEFINDKNEDTPPAPNNPPGNTPQTGDDTRIGFWLARMILAMVGIIISSVLFVRKKRFSDSEENV